MSAPKYGTRENYFQGILGDRFEVKKVYRDPATCGVLLDLKAPDEVAEIKAWVEPDGIFTMSIEGNTPILICNL
jgi:hypothetical protein